MHHHHFIQAFAEVSHMSFLFQAEKFQSTESFLLQKLSHAFDYSCSHSLNVFQFYYIFFEMVTTELRTDLSLELTMGMMLFTVLLSVVFLVTPNFWFGFYLLLSTELMSSRNYTLMFHSLVAMVSMRSSIRMRNGNFSSCALLYIYLYWISPANLFSHLKSLHHPPQSAFILINLDIFVPSANVTWQLMLFFRSFMNILNIGPSTDPCATPLMRSICSENDCLSLASISINSFSEYFLLLFWLLSVLSSLWQGTSQGIFYLQGHLHLPAADPFRDNQGSLLDRSSLYTSNFVSFEVYPISSHISEFSTVC